MRTGIYRHVLYVMFILLTVVGCQTVRPQNFEPVSFHGIELKMTEKARDGEYPLPSDDPFYKIDALSSLQLQFELPEQGGVVEADPRWSVLIDVLDQLHTAQAEYKRLAVRAETLSGNGVEPDSEYIESAQAHMSLILRIGEALTGVGGGAKIMTREQFTDLTVSDLEKPFTAIIEAIQNEREELHRAAARLAEDGDQYEVVVRAARLPRLGGREALHVPGYDTLPQGDYQPLNPFGLIPNEAESVRLKAELEAAGKVSAGINEVIDNRERIVDSLKETIWNLRRNLEQLVDTYRASWQEQAGAWQRLLTDEMIESIRAVPTSGGEQDALANALEAVLGDVDLVIGLIDEIDLIISSVNTDTLLSPLLFNEGSQLIERIEGLSAKMKTLETNLNAWEIHLETIRASIPKVIEQGATDTASDALSQVVSIVHPQFVGLSQSLFDQLPAAQGALDVVTRYFTTRNRDFLASNLALGTDPVTDIPRPLEDLVPAKLDLRRAGVALGDYVEVGVDFRRKDESDQQFRPDFAFGGEVGHAGWHTRYSADVIFARDGNGPNSDAFHSSVGLSLELHRYVRNKPNGWWNILDPGLGFHSAFLNQDPDQNVEFGAGVNASLFDGLIRVGYGYNLSAKDNNGYWMVGFGLLSVFDQAKNLVGIGE